MLTTITKMEQPKVLCFLLVLIMLANSAKSQLSIAYYASSCPQAEGIVRSTVQSHFNSDPTIAPGLLRLHFHDCFVQVFSMTFSLFCL